MRILLASEGDIAAASAVMVDSATWLIESGMPLWNPAKLTPEKIRPFQEKQELYLAWIGGEAAGTILLQEKDELFWPELTDNDSLFFHKLAVPRKFAGRGVSKALMDFAYAEAVRRGKKFLRLDCSARHPRLRPFYESHGFEFLDQRHVGEWFVDRLFRRVQ